jgi:hypothetical protein
MRLSRTTIELLFSAIIALFLLWVVWEPRNWPAPARLFPRSLGLSALALALIQLGVAGRAVLLERRTGAVAVTKDPLPQDIVDSRDHPLGQRKTAPEPPGRSMVTISIWFVVFFLGIWLVGFKIGSFLLTFAFLKFTAKEKWSLSAGIALGTYLFLWLVFDVALKLPLGNGVLGDFLTFN